MNTDQDIENMYEKNTIFICQKEICFTWIENVTLDYRSKVQFLKSISGFFIAKYQMLVKQQINSSKVTFGT